MMFTVAWRRCASGKGSACFLGPHRHAWATLLVWVIVVAGPSSQHASAAAIFFSDVSDFLAAEPNVAEVGFEQPFDPAASVSFEGFTVTEKSSASTVRSRTDYVSEGDRSLGFTWNGDGLLEIQFDAPTYSFATNILDFGTCCGATDFQVTDDTGQVQASAAVGGSLPRGNLQFFGLVADVPFQSLRFTSNDVSHNDLIVFDELLYRSVPVPATSPLAASLLFGLLVRTKTIMARH